MIPGILDPTGRCEDNNKIYLIKKDLCGIILFQDSGGFFYIK
jgi:hypothetical protein